MPTPGSRSAAVTSRLRLRGFDYSQPGDYFVTVVTHNRLCLFGTIENGAVALSGAGQATNDLWASIPEKYPHINLDAWVVMPNHLHGILSINAGEDGFAVAGLGSISTAMQWFKTQSTRAYGVGVRTKDWPPYHGKLWQPGFHDRVLRNDQELDQKREYILANPSQWPADDIYPHEPGASLTSAPLRKPRSR